MGGTLYRINHILNMITLESSGINVQPCRISPRSRHDLPAKPALPSLQALHPTPA
jgi:hypothetical protein